MIQRNWLHERIRKFKLHFNVASLLMWKIINAIPSNYWYLLFSRYVMTKKSLHRRCLKHLPIVLMSFRVCLGSRSKQLRAKIESITVIKSAYNVIRENGFFCSDVLWRFWNSVYLVGFLGHFHQHSLPSRRHERTLTRKLPFKLCSVLSAPFFHACVSAWLVWSVCDRCLIVRLFNSRFSPQWLVVGIP